MIVKVFLKEKGRENDETRRLRRILEEIEHEGYKVEMWDPDSPKGKEVAEVYDVVSPSVLVVRENGAEVMSWKGVSPRNAGDLRYFLGHQVSKLIPSRVSLTLKRPTGKKTAVKSAKPKGAKTISDFPVKKEHKTIKRAAAKKSKPKPKKK